MFGSRGKCLIALLFVQSATYTLMIVTPYCNAIMQECENTCYENKNPILGNPRQFWAILGNSGMHCMWKQCLGNLRKQGHHFVKLHTRCCRMIVVMIHCNATALSDFLPEQQQDLCHLLTTMIMFISKAAYNLCVGGCRKQCWHTTLQCMMNVLGTTPAVQHDI